MAKYITGRWLVADTLTELHEAAQKAGFTRAWFYDGLCPHYKIGPPRSMSKLIRMGATVVGIDEAKRVARRSRTNERT